MLFNSFEFLIFLPVVFILHYIAPHRFRWLVLLVGSYVFYMSWEWKYLSLIILSTGIDYLVGRALGATHAKFRRRLLLLVSLTSNLGILFFFKYSNFFIENANGLLESLRLTYLVPYTDFLLPMGISFYTFQTMAYTIDVYRGQAKVEKHLGYFALYVSYFPQLVAGPIERAQNLLDQLKAKSQLKSENLIWGLKLVVWGLFKKMVIADRLGVYVSQIYDQPHEASAISVCLATVFFALQIYCDFSGYSDIAIGVARMFGVKLMDNFRVPYISKSIGEFWARWHISLSTWFRDYLYIPLGGNRVRHGRWLANIMIVFIVSGFWHGANWTFIIWGAIHGFYLLMERIMPKFEVNRILKTLFIFSLVCFGWLFFRAQNINSAFALLSELTILNLEGAIISIREFGAGRLAFLVLLSIAFIAFDPNMDKQLKGGTEMSFWNDSFLYGFLVATIFLFGNFGEISFIYFQF